ncbi:uncharacterized protein LOC115447329 isoform X2 [Manduca sexta]|nr:uncharacterized protein LOC115447329 isoform X2 [Manduca sexta]
MCEHSSEWATAACPADAPYCATIALAPNFRSTLTCSADSKTSCSLTYTSENVIQLTCVCREHFCNTPLSQTLRKQLLNFSSKNNTSANLTETFYKIAISANSTELNLYKEITSDVTEVTVPTLKNTSQVTTLPPVSSTTLRAQSITRHAELSPQAEALKQETTAPSDDDEDESEGSGAYEEARSHHPASAPAAPSSFLPANENIASSLPTNLILITSLAAYSLV